MKKEICICSAIRYKDKIWRGHRHDHAIEAARDELSFNHSRKQILRMKGLFEEQGFITSKNRYVSRAKGRKLQDAAKIKSVAKGGYRQKTLFSEDLY